VARWTYDGYSTLPELDVHQVVDGRGEGVASEWGEEDERDDCVV
jgi:hypothetical protein